MMLAICITIAVMIHADKTWSPADFDSVEVWPTRPPTQKEAADSGVTLKEAMNMPWFPTHEIYCANGRLCRPGEGNLKGYRFWGQPYIHRESYVQSRHRTQPHEPNPQAEYSKLASLARRVQKENLVMMAAADWDFRRIILNWIIHAHRLGYTNALVLSMDVELDADLRRRGLPSVDNSANLDAWNTTCLQRHVQRVRTERVLAVAALLKTLPATRLPAGFNGETSHVGRRKRHDAHFHAAEADLRAVHGHRTGPRQIPAQKHLRRIVGVGGHPRKTDERRTDVEPPFGPWVFHHLSCR